MHLDFIINDSVSQVGKATDTLIPDDYMLTSVSLPSTDMINVIQQWCSCADIKPYLTPPTNKLQLYR